MPDLLDLVQSLLDFAKENWQIVLVLNTGAIAAILFVGLVAVVTHLPVRHPHVTVELSTKSTKAIQRAVEQALLSQQRPINALAPDVVRPAVLAKTLATDGTTALTK